MSFKELAEKLASARQTEAGPANGAGAGEGAGDGKGATALVKSFVFKLEDGTEVEAQDGAELVKAMNARLDEIATGHATAMTELRDTVLTPMFELVKSLDAQVAKLSGTGAGRRATVSLPTGGNGGQDQGQGVVTAEQVLAKAHKAQEAGRMSGIEVATVEGYLTKGIALPANLTAKLD